MLTDGKIFTNLKARMTFFKIIYKYLVDCPTTKVVQLIPTEILIKKFQYKEGT